MNNALDYLNWRGDLLFAENPVNEIDLFLCSQLSTPDYSLFLGNKQEKLSDVAARYFSDHSPEEADLGLLQSKSVLPMLSAMSKCRRFENTLLMNAVQQVRPGNMEQFQAVTVRLDEGILAVSIRGTDDTIIGWKEDCYLAVEDEVPAQRDAVAYLSYIAKEYPEDRLYIVGHSKGGNLAIYAAINSAPEIQDRIIRAVGFDSPGFHEKVFADAAYRRIADRIVTVVSQHSIVGMFLSAAGRYVLVRSAVSGPMAHDGFNWEVMGPSFVREKKLSDFSASFTAACYITLGNMNREQRKQFVDTVFDILMSAGATTVTELVKQHFLTNFRTISKLAKSKVLRNFLGVLIAELEKAGQNVEQIHKLLAEATVSADDE